MIRAGRNTIALAILWIAASGHVGSPDVWFEGFAGPYNLSVNVIPAGVVPGVAKVYVRAIGDAPSVVTIQADKFDATGGSPPPEPTVRAAGDEALFEGQLWIMSAGSNSITINATGPKGSGKAVVPVVMVPSRRLDLGTPTAIGLGAMGLFLFVGLVSIVGAAVREGSLAPGAPPTASTVRRARVAMAMTSVIAAVLLFGGWTWWNAEDAEFSRSIYRPFDASAGVTDNGGARSLTFSITDSFWVHRGDSAWLANRRASSWSPLVKDHGKLMHLFAVSNDMTTFAHVHPSTEDSVRFVVPVPGLPAGRYRVYGEVVHESGFTHTMVTSAEVAGDLEALLPYPGADADDGYHTAAIAPGSLIADAGDGLRVEWRRPAGTPVVAGLPASLSFLVTDASGSPVELEPYMGMAGHAVVQRDDGSVFVHLHPMGTISMASQMAFEMREPGDSVRGRLGQRISAADMGGHSAAPPGSGAAPGTLSFPYAFPKGGVYRVWVQVKRQGRVHTAAFDVSVADP